jgi:hypothetical protein
MNAAAVSGFTFEGSTNPFFNEILHPNNKKLCLPGND